MNNGTQFAVALILFWIAGVSFFVAFHPGGITINGRPAQNPVDILKYFIEKTNQGSVSAASNPATAPPPVQLA